jgi:hypothetical protein
MTAWSSSLLSRVEKILQDQPQWANQSSSLGPVGKKEKSIHLAVFVEPFLQFLLEGRKTVESRFSIHRRAPFGCVNSGDLVLIKESGGPVVAVAEVSKVWYYQLDESAWDVIRSRFSRQLCVEDPEFWKSKAFSCFATLMQFARIDKLEPVSCSKKDRRGWVVLGGPDRQPELFSLRK